MSRVGKNPVEIPKGVEVSMQDTVMTFKGPLGTFIQEIHQNMEIVIEQNKITVKTSEQKNYQGLHGLTRTLIANSIKGVTEGFKKILEIQGVGYRAEIKDNVLVLQLGFSHPVNFTIPKGIDIKIERQNKISVSGIDKQQVGEVSAKIRNFKRPEPYKGKGIRYSGEYVRRKVGKTGISAGTSK